MSDHLKQSPFMQSLPVTLTSFANKVGDIGMRVFPMLLIEIGATNNQSSMTLGLVKGAGIISTLVGGSLSDRLGSKRVILLSFLVSAIGMLLLANVSKLAVVCLAGVAISFGQGLFAAPLRLLLFETTDKNIRQEALAWLRTANNGAILVANAVAYAAASLGLAGLFVFDACTSMLAIIIGGKFLPIHRKQLESNESSDKKQNEIDSAKKILNKKYFYSLALIIAFFTFVSEVFFVSAAALAKLQFHEMGVAIFAQVYMINTGLCMIGSVSFSKWFRNPKIAMPIGMLIQTIGVVYVLFYHQYQYQFYIAVLLQTIGEIFFAATAQFTLLNAIPGGAKSGTIYSTSLFLQQCGKMIAGIIAFQLLEIV